jgi:hypothetical protein
MANIAEQLKINRCALVKNFVAADEAELLAEDFLSAHRENRLEYDPAYKGYVAYNHPTFLKLLVYKTEEVSKLVGEDVIPTYSYARIYTKGAELPKHIDRDACDVSFTLNLKQDTPWAIAAEASDGTAISFDLQPSDAMIYYGCEAPHWRDGAFTGEQYIQLFLHYVRLNGIRSRYYFDKQ